MNKRHVRVIFDNGEAVALIRAHSEAAAIQYHLRDRFEAPIADQDHLLKYGAKFEVIEAPDERKKRT
jgi:hypothetical protein